MNQQWLTILLSKGIELEQTVKQGLSQAQDELKKQLEQRGIRLNPVDLAAMLEEVSPRTSRAALSVALDLVRPFSAGMGFRISRMSNEQIEMVIPDRTRNQNENGMIHEAASMAAAIEAVKLLWLRHAPIGEVEMKIKSTSMEIFKDAKGELRVRLEIPEAARELILATVRQEKKATQDLHVQLLDTGDAAVAAIEVKLELHYNPSLAAPSA